MPRLPRISFPNAVYHVTARGNGRARIFFDDDDRRRFLRQLEDNVKTQGIMPYALLLMDNHFHLLAPTPRVSPWMQLRQSRSLRAPAAGDTLDQNRPLVSATAACRLTGKTSRAVGMHYGAISGAAVGNIRRKIREAQNDIPREIARLLPRIRRAGRRTPKV